MNCPQCAQKMQIDRHDVSTSSNNHKEYNRTVYRCKTDDVWVTVEIPKEGIIK